MSKKKQSKKDGHILSTDTLTIITDFKGHMYPCVYKKDGKEWNTDTRTVAVLPYYKEEV